MKQAIQTSCFNEEGNLKAIINEFPRKIQNIDARLVIAGEFWKDKHHYLKMIKDLNLGKKVKIIERYIPNEEIPYFFYASDIVVLPNTSVTGSGLAQLALGFNKPVVVSRIGILSEVVCDRKTGFPV